MRKFLLNIIIVGLVAAIILCFFTWMGVRKIDHTSFRLPDDIHLIAIGPSTTQGSVNDTLIAGLQNISRDGTGFDYLAPILSKLLEGSSKISNLDVAHKPLASNTFCLCQCKGTVSLSAYQLRRHRNSRYRRRQAPPTEKDPCSSR